MFLQVPVCSQGGGVRPGILTCPLLDIRPETRLPPSASDVLWCSLETCSKLVHLGTSPRVTSGGGHWNWKHVQFPSRWYPSYRNALLFKLIPWTSNNGFCKRSLDGIWFVANITSFNCKSTTLLSWGEEGKFITWCEAIVSKLPFTYVSHPKAMKLWKCSWWSKTSGNLYNSRICPQTFSPTARGKGTSKFPQTSYTSGSPPRSILFIFMQFSAK